MVVVDCCCYYLGLISGKKVIVVMIGIGLVNVINIIEIVFVCFICVFFIVIVVVMFLGVVGGVGCISIGDVVILVWWILDNGVIFCGVDFGMLVIV